MTDSQAVRLGALLRQARLDHGLSTHQLAAIVEVNQSRLVRLEQGKTAQRPEPALLQRLCEALDLPLSTVYELAGIRMPALKPYLRASYGLTETDAVKAQTYIEQLAERYGAPGPGPLNGADETP
jgi:transcriptional regulator with XRE-family HTH domain